MFCHACRSSDCVCTYYDIPCAPRTCNPVIPGPDGADGVGGGLVVLNTTDVLSAQDAGLWSVTAVPPGVLTKDLDQITVTVYASTNDIGPASGSSLWGGILRVRPAGLPMIDELYPAIPPGGQTEVVAIVSAQTIATYTFIRINNTTLHYGVHLRPVGYSWLHSNGYQGIQPFSTDYTGSGLAYLPVGVCCTGQSVLTVPNMDNTPLPIEFQLSYLGPPNQYSAFIDRIIIRNMAA